MALTAGGRIVANLYGSGIGAQGKTQYFPFSGGITFYGKTQTPNNSSVVTNSVIEVLPTGLRNNSTLYYAVETPTQLIANGS